MSRIERKMAQDELDAVEQHDVLAMFHQNQGFYPAVQERRRRVRHEENPVVLESSVRCEAA